jgi:hypothetical protein
MVHIVKCMQHLSTIIEKEVIQSDDPSKYMEILNWISSKMFSLWNQFHAKDSTLSKTIISLVLKLQRQPSDLKPVIFFSCQLELNIKFCSSSYQPFPSCYTLLNFCAKSITKILKTTTIPMAMSMFLRHRSL